MRKQVNRKLRNSDFFSGMVGITILVATTMTPTFVFADTYTWVGPSEGVFNLGPNWDKGKVPGRNDSAVIEKAHVYTWYLGKPIEIHKLKLGPGVDFSTSEHTRFTATETEAINAVITASWGGSINLGDGNLDQSSLFACSCVDNAYTRLTTSISSWKGTTNYNENRYFKADEYGAWLDLSSITTIRRSTYGSLLVKAHEGGVVDLSGLTNITGKGRGKIVIISDGVSDTSFDIAHRSIIDLSNLQKLENSLVRVKRYGQVDLASLSFLTDSEIDVTYARKGLIHGISNPPVMQFSSTFQLTNSTLKTSSDGGNFMVGTGVLSNSTGILTINNDSKFGGTGEIYAAVKNAGQLGLDAVQEELDIYGSIDFLDGSSLHIDLGMDTNNMQFVDSYNVWGNINFDGNLYINVNENFTLYDGATFDFIALQDNNLYNFFGAFDTITDNDDNYRFDVEYGSGFATLIARDVNNTHQPVPEPATALLVGFSLLGLTDIVRKKNYQKKYLRTQRL